MNRHANGGLYKRCDCPRRLWPRCEHSYYFAFRHKGVRHRFPLDGLAKKHLTKEEAEAKRDGIRAEIRAGTFRDPREPEPESTDRRWTFDEVAEKPAPPRQEGRLPRQRAPQHDGASAGRGARAARGKAD